MVLGCPGRAPKLMVEVVARESDCDRLAAVVLRQSSSFGLRRSRVDRYALKRETIKIDLPEGAVNVKFGYLGTELVQVHPEYEDCRRLAVASGRTLRQIQRHAATEAWRTAGREAP